MIWMETVAVDRDGGSDRDGGDGNDESDEKQ
jgi:hypothetical protein